MRDCEGQTCVVASVLTRGLAGPGLFGACCGDGECNDDSDTPFIPLLFVEWCALGVRCVSSEFGCFFEAAEGVATSLGGVEFASRGLFLLLPYCSKERARAAQMSSEA
jgi:hypothetical protein